MFESPDWSALFCVRRQWAYFADPLAYLLEALVPQQFIPPDSCGDRLQRGSLPEPGRDYCPYLQAVDSAHANTRHPSLPIAVLSPCCVGILANLAKGLGARIFISPFGAFLPARSPHGDAVLHRQGALRGGKVQRGILLSVERRRLPGEPARMAAAVAAAWARAPVLFTSLRPPAAGEQPCTWLSAGLSVVADFCAASSAHIPVLAASAVLLRWWAAGAAPPDGQIRFAYQPLKRLLRVVVASQQTAAARWRRATAGRRPS